MGKAIKSSFDLAVIDLIRQKRLDADISQDEFATLLDVSRGFIGQVETPRHPSKYNLNHINKIAQILKCSPRELVPAHSM